MNRLWPSYLSFVVFLIGSVAFSAVSVWFGYFTNPTQNVLPLALAALISALMACMISESIAKKVCNRYDKYGE